jgi:hypothetical protein
VRVIGGMEGLLRLGKGQLLAFLKLRECLFYAKFRLKDGVAVVIMPPTLFLYHCQETA